MIRTEKVNLIYDIDKSTETYALKNININLKENKLYGILGPSGSGKSSLLYILSGLKKPSSGKVYIDDLDINSIKEKELSNLRKKKFGFIFQRHFLIDYLNAIDNVLVPINSKNKNDLERGMYLLETLGLKNEIYKKPYQLSGGQCQRVAIARALINEPDIVFADEITAALDHNNAFNVMKVLSNFKNKTTILIVTHDESILEDADEIINIWDGTVKEIRKGQVKACSL